MADQWGALAQSIPAAAALTDIYTVPGARQATVNVVACNRSGLASLRLSHAIAGAANANKQYLLYDFSLGANETKATEQITVNEGDVIRAYSDTGNVVFIVNGIEEDK